MQLHGKALQAPGRTISVAVSRLKVKALFWFPYYKTFRLVIQNRGYEMPYELCGILLECKVSIRLRAPC